MAATTLTGIPLTVVGGFLGAGKTTLLNRLLQQSDRRIAVLVNDFGAINIDAELVSSRESETISLTNGCICCGLSGEFMFALAGLRDRDDPPEQVVVEASGIGDPAAIAQYGEIPGFRRDAAVVVVDAETARVRASDRHVGPQVRGQLRSADLIVLNKSDLVSSSALRETRAWLREAAPFASIVDASFGDVSTDIVLGARHHAPPKSQVTPPLGSHHEPGYATWSWVGDAPLDGKAFCEAVIALPEDVLRAKGILHLREDTAHRYVLQLVGRRWSIERDRPWGDETPGSRLVLIGLPESIRPDDLASTMTGLTGQGSGAST